MRTYLVPGILAIPVLAAALACGGDDDSPNCPADIDCTGLTCGIDPVCGTLCDYCPAGQTCNSFAGRCESGSGWCGDGSCSGGETCTSCPADCGSCGCPPGALDCGDECLSCAASERPFCGSNGPNRCCAPDLPVFCDRVGLGTGCWPAGTDCSTMTRCGAATFACQVDVWVECDSSGTGYCCDVERAFFCDSDLASSVCAGCYASEYSDRDCRTATYCAARGACGICETGYHVNCADWTCES
jgi:hypothetical protein